MRYFFPILIIETKIARVVKRAGEPAIFFPAPAHDFFQAAPAPDFFPKRLRIQGAKKTRLRLLTIC